MIRLYNIKENEILIVLLWAVISFLLIQPNVATPFIGYIGRFYYALLFVFTIRIVQTYWRITETWAKILFSILLISRLFLYVSRIMYGDSFETDTYRDLCKEVVLIEFFFFIIRRNTWEKLKGISILLALYIVINYVTIVLYPQGMVSGEIYDTNWFLGYKNGMIRIILPGLILNMLCSIHEYKKIVLKDFLLLFISLLSVYWADSLTSVLMLFILIFLIIYYQYVRILKFFSLTNVFILTSTISVLITFFSIQTYFSNFVSDYLNRDVTFTDRIYVWEFSLFKISLSPIIGYGYHNSEEWRSVLGFYDIMDVGFSHPHNFLYYCLLQGGVVYLALFFFIIFYVNRNIKNNYESFNGIVLLVCMYFVFFIEGISESITNAVLFFPMFGLFPIFKRDILKVRYTHSISKNV